MIGTNACSTAQGRHAELVHLAAQLVSGRKLEQTLPRHEEVDGRCRNHNCQQAWPCDGWRFVEQVIALQRG